MKVSIEIAARDKRITVIREADEIHTGDGRILNAPEVIDATIKDARHAWGIG